MSLKHRHSGVEVVLRGRYILMAPDDKTADMVEKHGKYLLALGKSIEEVKAELRGRNAGITLDTYFDEWHATLTVSEASKYRYKLNYERIGRIIGSKPLASIATNDMRKVVSVLSARYSPKTVRVSVATLMQVMRAAQEDGLLQRMPTVRNMPVAHKTREARVITREEWKLLIASCPDPWKPMVAIWPLTGLRIGEMLGLARNDVDIVARRLRIAAQIRPNEHKRVALKTKESADYVPLTGEAIKWLQVQLRDGYPSDDGLLFATPEGKVLSRTSWKRVQKTMCEAAGFWVNAHDFRHTAGSWLLDSGASLADVSKFLRHSSINTTAGSYAHAIAGAEPRMVERFDQYVSGEDVGKASSAQASDQAV